MGKRLLQKVLSSQVLLVALLIVAPFSTAKACLWRISDAAMPFPPCPMNDALLQARLRQGVVRQLVQTGELGMEVYNMKLESQGRQGTNEVIEKFVDRLDQVQGDVSVPPVPSLVAAYETSPMITPVEGDSGVQFVYLATGIDTTAVTGGADWQRYMNTDSISRMYSYTANQGDSAMLKHLVALQQLIDSMARGGDSLTASGNRYATRYQGAASNSGESEAKLSELFSSDGLSKSAIDLAMVRAAETQTRVQTGAKAANNATITERRAGGHQ